MLDMTRVDLPIRMFEPSRQPEPTRFIEPEARDGQIKTWENLQDDLPSRSHPPPGRDRAQCETSEKRLRARGQDPLRKWSALTASALNLRIVP